MVYRGPIVIDLIKTIIAKILKKSRLSSLFNSQIHYTSKVEAGSSIYFSSFDRHSFCGYDCDLYYAKIGSFTSIANNVVIGGARHPLEWVSTSPAFYKGRDSIKKKYSEFVLESPPVTKIGHDVWIGQGATILSGVSVGNGAVIGAASVVTKDVPAYAIVAGNPAKIIRFRFDPTIILELEQICWWALDDKQIDELAKNIKDPRLFIATYRNKQSAHVNPHD